MKYSGVNYKQIYRSFITTATDFGRLFHFQNLSNLLVNECESIHEAVEVVVLHDVPALHAELEIHFTVNTRHARAEPLRTVGVQVACARKLLVGGCVNFCENYPPK